MTLPKGAVLFQLADALLELGESNQDGAADAAPPSRLPEREAPVKQGVPNRRRGCRRGTEACRATVACRLLLLLLLRWWWWPASDVRVGGKSDGP